MSTTTVLHDCTLVDGTGADPVPDAVVVVTDGRIASADRAGAADEPSDAVRVDLRGNTLCPGFFDCHVHFGLPGSGAPPLDKALKPPSYGYFELLERLRTTLHDAARTRTRELIRAGADVVKIASSGGVASPNDDPSWLGLRREAIAAIVEEAANYGGRPVAAHAIGHAGIRAAVEGGVRSIEHGYALDDELRHRMVEQGTFLVPTLLETMQPVTSSPASVAKSAKWHALAHDSLRASVAAGVRVALGTDAGLGPAHGTNLAELGLLVQFGGLSPMQAIVAGTLTSAQLCGLDATLGSVQPGKLADLVVVRGDPLADIGSLGDPENVLLVVKGGDVVGNRGGFALRS
ncbi:amidohydrolase family protein [Mycolicibacterium sp. 050158]|uniref:amidohydrolase family protein n=1 Tax=Mycolicibacterium sp. 050158 TaxID=3090602 RepID=UPI00299E1B35|nr:amidohydrolase family protein [Mycolicibacterium sp. 050158]MDX1892918.1 amidohydrolase family protein [Mycolicibacterium sp. 050158]